jgi:hypothetical protein
MPTFDGGHYFLTALIPVRTETIQDGDSGTSPVHALRKVLDLLPTAAQTLADGHSKSPFARDTRTHFARFVIIDDVAYNGRDPRNTLWTAIIKTDLMVAQTQDHLSCPFLLFTADFDAASGADGERDRYLAELWNTMGQELRNILQFCQGFSDDRIRDGRAFAGYIADCQLETTMSFNDYYVDPLNLPTWPAAPYLGAIALCAAVTLLGVIAASLPPFVPAMTYAGAVAGLGAVACALAIWAAYRSVMAAGAKPFPKAPDSDLPTALKALHLQREFTRFAIDLQAEAAGSDMASAQKLYGAFKTFLDDTRPDQLSGPTQAPGVIGI